MIVVIPDAEMLLCLCAALLKCPLVVAIKDKWPVEKGAVFWQAALHIENLMKRPASVAVVLNQRNGQNMEPVIWQVSPHRAGDGVHLLICRRICRQHLQDVSIVQAATIVI